MNTDIVSAPIVMAIKMASAPVTAGSNAAKTRTVGVAYADSSTRELGVADFVDNDIFSNTEVCYTQMISSLSAKVALLWLAQYIDSHHSTLGERSHHTDWDSFWDDRARLRSEETQGGPGPLWCSDNGAKAK